MTSLDSGCCLMRFFVLWQIGKGKFGMRVLTLNVNCFGGKEFYREEFKEMYGRRHIYEWDKIPKKINWEGVLNVIEKESPDIVCMQEFDVNSKEAQEFIEKINYDVKYEIPEIKRPSMTVMFIKKGLSHKYIANPHERNLRAYAIDVNDVIVYGTHVPPSYDDNFWNEMDKMYMNHAEKKLVFIGDFNTVNYRNMNRLNSLLQNDLVDAWTYMGKSPDESTVDSDGMRLDYILVSYNVKCSIKDIRIIPEPLDKHFTDHKAIVVDIEKI